MNEIVYGFIKGSSAVQIAFFAMFVVFAINIIFALIKVRKENMYSYSIMYYIGGLVFVIFNIILYGYLMIVDKNRGFDFNDFMIYIFNSSIYFIYALLPAVFIFAIFLFISNIVLIKKEGGGVRNLLAIGLGLFLIGATAIISLLGIISPFNDTFEFIVDTILFGLLSYFECIMFGTFVATVITHRRIPARDRDYIMILGCGLREDGTPIPLLQGRIDRAMWFAAKQKREKGRDIVYVCSGGQGPDEVISEGESMHNYLVEHGVSEDNIIIENKSTSTYENIKFSMDKINHYRDSRDISTKGNIAFSTTDYHVFRSGNIAYNLGIKALGIGSRSKWYFYVNALVREFAANLKAQRVRHIVNIAIIIVVLAIFHIINFFYYSV